MTKRLTQHLKPNHYAVHFILADDLASFESHSTIDATAQKETDVLELHAKDLDITTLTVTAGKTTIEVQEHSFNTAEDLLVIKLKQPLAKDSAVTIKTIATATVTPTMHGIYPAHYEEDGPVIETSKVAFAAGSSTQTNASRAW